MTTADDIRASAIGRTAQCLADLEGYEGVILGRHYSMAEGIIAKLDDLFPTGVVWGAGEVEDYTGDEMQMIACCDYATEGEAREVAHDHHHDGKILRQWLHAWREMEP